MTNKKRTHCIAGTLFCRVLMNGKLYGGNKQNRVEQKNTAIPLEIAVFNMYRYLFFGGRLVPSRIFFMDSPFRGKHDRYLLFHPTFLSVGIV